MERLFLFFYQYRAFFIFLLLEFVCVSLIVSSNHYQRAQFFNSSGSLVANMNNFSYGVSEYFSLRETNLKLAEENALLRSRLEQYDQQPYPLDMPVLKDSLYAADSLSLSDSLSLPDSSAINRYEYISARVVNNSVDRFTNFITIDKGAEAGIEEGMAVINHSGAVGKVKATSAHYSVVTSLLNIDVMTSSMINRTGHFGTVQWNGRDPLYAHLKYIPPHVKPMAGDSVVTSGYNSVFPKDVLIGTIEEVELGDAALFYDLKVRLSQDFQKLTYVTVVKSNLKAEQDSLQLPFQRLEP